jgi:hypothetical protein
VADPYRRAFGEFVQEDHCRCGFTVDRYEDRYGGIEYEDPDTSLRITECPDCGRGLDLLGQRATSAALERDGHPREWKRES